MIRKATQADAAAIEAFLVPHAETSMFLRGNLATHGVGQTDHPHSTDFYLWEESGGICGVFGATKQGNLMVQAPGVPAEAFDGFACALDGCRVVGMTGPPDMVRAVLEACGLTETPCSVNAREPLYALDLAVLTDSQADLRAISDADVPQFTQWTRAYMLETGLSATEEAAQEAAERRARMAVGGPARFLRENGAPVAMAAINASVADMVQVGGVYVPPELRGRGLGGRVTAALLAEARANGARKAILFAASEAAARVYETIGFRLIGAYAVAQFAQPASVVPRKAVAR